MQRIMNRFPARNAGQRITDMGPSVSAPRQVLQDVPPPGGFKPARIKRNMPNKFFGVGTTILVVSTIMGIGWYRYLTWYKKKTHLKREEEDLQLAMTPFLQAEHDISFTIKKRAFMKKVAKLMENEENFNVNEQFYNDKKSFKYPRMLTELAVFEGTGLLESEQNA